MLKIVGQLYRPATSAEPCQSFGSARRTPSRAATAWALVRWSSYQLVTEVLEVLKWPNSLEMAVTGVPAAEVGGEGVA